MTVDPDLRETARAKVNLCLHVTGRRPDGYHLLDSLAVFAEIGDTIRAEPAETLELRITGPQAAGLAAGPDNLVLRAASVLARLTGIEPRLRLVLDKHLPVASGIGGGSADAAATLRLLVRLWELPLTDDVLATLALPLGADVPVCLAGRPARMRGIGEVIEPVPVLPPCGLLLVNPGIGVSTPEVFRARTGPFSNGIALPDAWQDATSLAAWLEGTSNDLQAPAIGVCPVIATVLAALRAQPDCLLARMSGSGATCFALFPDPVSAATAARAVSQPGWWCWGGALAS